MLTALRKQINDLEKLIIKFINEATEVVSKARKEVKRIEEKQNKH
jgi:hypothetical protein